MAPLLSSVCANSKLSPPIFVPFLTELDQRLLLSGSLPSSASAAGFAGAPLIFSTGAHSAASQLLKNATGQNNSPMPLASAQPLMAVATSLAQQNQQQQQHAAFLQQLGMSNGFLATATPGPYGLALANTQSCPTNAGILTGTNGQFDLLALTKFVVWHIQFIHHIVVSAISSKPNNSSSNLTNANCLPSFSNNNSSWLFCNKQMGLILAIMQTLGKLGQLKRPWIRPVSIYWSQHFDHFPFHPT
jgi:hypothetical protein